MSLGLLRGTVRLEEHDDAWDASAREVIRDLWEVLREDAADIQHVGSTAIRGIAAKPVVDLAVGVRSLDDMRRHDAALAERGILFRKRQFGDQLLYVVGEEDVRTHHIHVVIWNGEAWRDYIAFRDYLNAHPHKAGQYSALKMSLAARFPTDRESYNRGKQDLIASLLREARSWKDEHPL